MINDQTSNSSRMSSQQKQRKHRRPPARLSWPMSVGESSFDKKPCPRKRPRTSSSGSSPDQVAMWVDKFTPQSSSELCVAPKKLQEIRDFLEESSRGCHRKLLVLVGSPGIGKSATVRVLAKELHLSVKSWNESYLPREHGGAAARSMFSLEQTSPIDSFQEFLQQCGTGFSSLHLSDESSSFSSSAGQKSVILLEELPNSHGQDAESRFRDVMTEHLRRSRVPTVLIFSDVSEGKHRPDDLERLIDRRQLYSQTSTILQIHPVTKPRMKKILEKIAKQQKFLVTPTLLEELHNQSRGDIRHAIMTLQLQSSGIQSLANRKISQNDRDVKLSTFHALGKLLYAKRTEKDGRSVLAFDPEEIMERSDLGIGGSLRFLEYHSTEFFSDITDLSNAYSLFSDAVTLLDNPIESYHGNGCFPDGYACSIAGRAVANTNTMPTPNKFRQFSTPKVFDVIRKRKQNQIMVDQLSRRLTYCHLSLSGATAYSNTFVTEMLPAMRMIIPEEVNPSVDNLYSVARENLVSEERHSNREEDDKALKEQTEILEMDDIVDYDSEDSTPNHDSKGSHLNHAAASAPPPTMKGPENSQEIIVIDD